VSHEHYDDIDNKVHDSLLRIVFIFAFNFG